MKLTLPGALGQLVPLLGAKDYVGAKYDDGEIELAEYDELQADLNEAVVECAKVIVLLARQSGLI